MEAQDPLLGANLISIGGVKFISIGGVPKPHVQVAASYPIMSVMFCSCGHHKREPAKPLATEPSMPASLEMAHTPC